MAGMSVIELTIGEPDIAPDRALNGAIAERGRLGEPSLPAGHAPGASR